MESVAATFDEAVLLDRLRAGDDAAFAEVVQRYGGRMLSVARRIVHSEEDARDAVQDAFLSAFRALESFDGQSQLGTWLHRIGVNAALQKLRKSRRSRECSIEQLLPQFIEDGHQRDPAIAWEPCDLPLEQAETKAIVREAIDQLPEDFRTVLILRDIEGLDTQETAELLSIGLALVKTRLHRARQALRTLLDAHIRGGSL
jgi:RNA polymerase sigma-70 factor (ECF subfamily)